VCASDCGGAVAIAGSEIDHDGCILRDELRALQPEAEGLLRVGVRVDCLHGLPVLQRRALREPATCPGATGLHHCARAQGQHVPPTYTSTAEAATSAGTVSIVALWTRAPGTLWKGFV
jgi:hypothetical protein